MSEAREASWYEIALTHSQVVKIFVGLLLCLVASFFSGIWIGRDAVNAVEPVSPAVRAQAQPGLGATDDTGDAEAQPEVGQLHFFSEDDVATEIRRPTPEAESAAAAAEPGTTLADDVRAQTPAAVEMARNDPDAPVEVTPEPQGAPAAAQVAGDLVVQVFSSNDAAQARRVLGRLAQGGHPAYLSPVDVSGRTMYRVRIGPYAERAEAEQVADTVRRTFKLDTWITQKST